MRSFTKIGMVSGPSSPNGVAGLVEKPRESADRYLDTTRGSLKLMVVTGNSYYWIGYPQV